MLVDEAAQLWSMDCVRSQYRVYPCVDNAVHTNPALHVQVHGAVCLTKFYAGLEL